MKFGCSRCCVFRSVISNRFNSWRMIIVMGYRISIVLSNDENKQKKRKCWLRFDSVFCYFYETVNLVTFGVYDFSYHVASLALLDLNIRYHLKTEWVSILIEEIYSRRLE